MKTAISIPDDLFDAAEDMSKRLGLSRSELYSTAVSSYLKKHRNDAVTEALNKVYDKEKSSVDSVISAMQNKSLPGGKW